MKDFKKLFYDLKAKAEQKRGVTEIIGKYSYDLYMKTRPNLKNKACLDVGVGTGWAMHSILADGCNHCDGIDISSERIQETDSLLKRSGFSNYSLQLADAENLQDYSSDYYDYVNYLDILEHLPDYKKGIQEVYRVLKRGGFVYIKTPNNYTDVDLKLHYYCQILFALFLPQHISPPQENSLMLRDDMKRLTEEEGKKLIGMAPEGFHEHIHQFYPDELCDFVSECGFDVIELTGTPLFTDVMYNNEAILQNFAKSYVAFLESGTYNHLIETLFDDLISSGSKPSFKEFPADYIFSDNLIVIARKSANGS
jgi:ubiquinone/menaquinone biosynthesis C-methylase UbiE